MVVQRLKVLFSLILLFFPVLSMAKVTATVDRNVIEEGETLQLIIQSDDGEPDINLLNRDFQILGTSQSSKVSIINGSVNSVKEWIISLAPKRIGTFVIPPIRAGNQASAPIRVQVNKPSFAASSQGADIFLEAKVDMQSVYVQSQVIYTVRLYRAVEIREGSLTEPDLSDAVVERLGEDVTFQTRRDGRLYQVTERRFAIFPQKSGTFPIASTVFQGQVVDNRNSNRRSNDPFDRFFQNQRTKRVRVKSDAVEINVNPQPDDAEGDFWLPAKRIILTESWSPEPPQFKVGEPVTRTLRMEAFGLTAAQLPELKPLSSSGLKQYADQPMVKTGMQDGMLVGVREEKFAIVPTQSGKIILPELRLYWWDTEMNKQEVITIPPKVIDVAPGEITSPNNNIPVPAQNQQPNVPESSAIGSDIPINTATNAGHWKILAIAAAAAWFITLLGWIMYWRKVKRMPIDSKTTFAADTSVSVSAINKQFKKACQNNDASEAKQALVAWAQAAWPNSASPSLSFIAGKLQDSTLNQSLRELNDVLYATEKKNWDGKKFWDIVSPRLKMPRSHSDNTVKSLPGLYPQSS